MLGKQDNERLTRVGPDTPVGRLFRRYWQPIAPAEHLDRDKVVPVRILGEDLALFRDGAGRLGLLEDRCPHRGTRLSIGIAEIEGLRCCYHGWLFDPIGQCREMPLEPADSTFVAKVRIKAYPVQELGGLVWAYMGPAPAPVLPRWDILLREGGFRAIVGHRIPTNWLQVVENMADPGHIPYGHGRFFQYALNRTGTMSADPATLYNACFAETKKLRDAGLHVEFRAIANPTGFTVGRKVSNEPDHTPGYVNGAQARIFPAMLSSGPGDVGRLVRRWLQFAVPIDDTTTWQFQYFSYFFPPGVAVPEQDVVPYEDVPVFDGHGAPIVDYPLGQDMAIFMAQGEVHDRTRERLGTADAVLVAYRRLLVEQLVLSESGADPINVFRDDAAANAPDLRIPGADTGLPPRNDIHLQVDGFHVVPEGSRPMIDDVVDRYHRDRDLLLRLYAQADSIVRAQC